ncbi:hypothetical protein EGR_11181 [Echinococcus granulosus]|uniref:Uncharacterized protein n=1 Tax=Echinococcus granulosus TaxID=6210 RepID=W6U6L5_ECHGR|nr:hypothetical protein EGR_11181 [Echinococcus granulosus]EUB53962.1 hypothetical protein EGR_11181 [Echinococcus granulosus]
MRATAAEQTHHFSDMQLFLFNSLLLLEALLPLSVLHYGYTIVSIINSILKDAPQYLATYAKKFHMESVESFARSCPVSFYETLVNGEVAKKVEISKMKLDVSVRVKKTVHPEVKLEFSASVFEDAYVYTKCFLTIPAIYLKSIIISQVAKKVEISKMKLDVSVRVKKTVHPEVKLEFSASVFEDAYVYTKCFLTIPAIYLKSIIISQVKTVIKSKLQAFISALE